MSEAAIDNDILYKGSWFGLLQQLFAATPGAPTQAVVLGQAKFVVAKKIERQIRKGIPNSQRALDHLVEFFSTLALTEPTTEELLIAAEVENAAAAKGLPLDAGESILCAVVATRRLGALVTGDKRAICAMELLVDTSPTLQAVAGRVVCLEQLFVALLGSRTGRDVRAAVCANAHADRALATCFACSSPEVGLDQCHAGLESYIQNLRETAPRMLLRPIP